MLKALIFSILTFSYPNLYASGCDSYYFQGGEIAQQKIIQDLGLTPPSAAQEIIENMSKAHKISLKHRKLPTITLVSRIRIITSIYSDLDTDCGWTHYGSSPSITHLEISSPSQEKIYYPDIYHDIYPEFLGENELIKIN